jgi:hypothetical protein
MPKRNSKIIKKKDLTTLNEPQPVYNNTEQEKKAIISQDYIPIEDFRVEAKKRVVSHSLNIIHLIKSGL